MEDKLRRVRYRVAIPNNTYMNLGKSSMVELDIIKQKYQSKCFKIG